MRRGTASLAVALVWLSGAAWAASPIVRAKLAPASQVTVGEPVRLSVQVLVPSWFTSPPQFPTIEMENALAVATDDSALNLNERIGEDSYAGVSKDYLIYPQTPGKHTLPPAEVTFSYAIDAKPSPEIRLKLPQESFTAVIPPQAEGLGYFVATTHLTLEQTLSRQLKDLKEGDTFHRVVTMRAEKTFAMFLPEIEFDAPDGIVVYPDAPKVEDIRDPRMGFQRGQRIDSAQYLIQKAGKYELPEISVSWWDLSAKQMRTVRLRAIEFEATPNPSYSPEIPPVETAAAPIRESPWERAKQVLPWAGGALIALVVIWWFVANVLPRWRRGLADRQTRRERSEPVLFGHVVAAAKKNDALETYQALARWAPAVTAEEDATISTLASMVAKPELATEIERLEAGLYGGESGVPEWRGAVLAEQLRVGRETLLKRTGAIRGSLQSLPPLNP